MSEKFYMLRCKIAIGGFSGERVVRLSIAGRKIHEGVVPRHYCYHINNEQIGKEEPETGTEIEGKLVARLIQEEGNGKALVYLPDGEVVGLQKSQIYAYEGMDNPHVPVES